MLAISGATVADVGLRWTLNSPIPGLNEIVVALMAVAVAACFPATSARDRHLRVETIVDVLPIRVKYVVSVAAMGLLLLWLSLLAWRFGVYAVNLAARGQTLTTTDVSLSWFMIGAALCFGLAVIVQLIAWVRLLGQRGHRASNDDVRTWPLIVGTIAAALLVLVGVQGAFWEAIAHIVLPENGFVLAIVMFGAVWLAVLIGVPVGAALGLAGLLGSTAITGFGPAISVVGTESAAYALNGELAVLPLFLLMGSFAAEAGLSGDLYRLANSVLGWVRGGLALGTIGASAAFGCLTGSSIATAATIGGIAIPEMRARGYSDEIAAGSVAAGGTLGQLVPPSTAAILYSILTEQSIGRVYIGMIVPALITVALYFVTVMLAFRTVERSTDRIPLRWSEFAGALARSWVLLFVLLAMFGGIYLGVFTVTEAAAVGTIATFIVALARGRLNRSAIRRTLISATISTGMIYLLIFGAAIFSFFIGLSGLTNAMAEAILGLHLAPILIVALLLLVYLVLGCIMDSFAVMVVTIPITSVLVSKMGFDLVWWGILMVCVIETGMLTPPFGMNCMILKGVAPDITLGAVYRGVIRFVIADIIKIVLILLVPALVLWLPSTMFHTTALR